MDIYITQKRIADLRQAITLLYVAIDLARDGNEAMNTQIDIVEEILRNVPRLPSRYKDELYRLLEKSMNL